jgi:hypothetical protein
VCFVLSDQNFIATMPGSEGKDCLKIVRIENSSLTELANIFLEIMEYKTVKPGTCILLTSLSHLSRVGAAAYAAEWRVAVNMLVSRWRECWFALSSHSISLRFQALSLGNSSSSMPGTKRCT